MTGENNTFKDSEFLKVLVYSTSKENSLKCAGWLTGSTNLWRGYLTSPFKSTKLIASMNYLNSDINSINLTVSSEAIIVYLETEEEWSLLKDTVKDNYKTIPTKIVVFKNELASKFAEEIGGFNYQNENPEDLIKLIDQADKKEYEKIYTNFTKYDKDKSGSIDLNELPYLAKALGEDPKSEAFQRAVMVFDSNKDNIISFEEFLVFWKIGRQNTEILSKIQDFNKFTKDHLNNFFNIQDFVRNAKKVNNKNLKVNNVAIKIATKEVKKIKSRIEFKLAIGGKNRLEAVKNFISKFTDNVDPINEQWINISIFLKSETIDSIKAKNYLEEFRTNLLVYLENTKIKGLGGFINNFLNFKSYNRGSSATVLFRLKFDVEAIFNSVFDSILQIKDNLSSGDKGFEIDFKIFSEDCIKEILEANQSLKSLLVNSEISLNSTGVKEKLRSLFLQTNKNYSKFLNLFQLLFASNDLKIDFNGPITDLIDKTSVEILTTKLDEFGKFIKFIKENLNPELLNSLKRLEIGFNLFDIFANIQIFSDTLWQVSQN